MAGWLAGRGLMNVKARSVIASRLLSSSGECAARRPVARRRVRLKAGTTVDTSLALAVPALTEVPAKLTSRDKTCRR